MFSEFSEKIWVPQGSVLELILFLVYINDLLDEISCDVSAFADDIFIFSLMCILNDQYDDLNKNLQKIHNWARKWMIIFEGFKFKIMNFGKSL